MNCPRCEHDNPPRAKFCEECATPLARTCTNCGTSLSPTAKFCPECAHPAAAHEPAADRSPSPESYTPKHLAEKILTSKSALEGERKQVTVLFVDVSGFTALSERLDPEEVHALMTRAFELMLTEVHRYEGTVNQFLGDGIMALFGAPIAHEDHAQRAVHAALGIQGAVEAYRDDLQRRRSIGFRLRQGLNTGLVVVGSIGSDLRMDYTAVGDTTNVAARMLQIADPGHIAVSEATHRLIEGYFHTRSLGAQSLKGKSEPVRAWEVVSARAPRTRLEVEMERGLTPFVGRERQLRTLLDAFEQAGAGQGQVVLLVGDPGIGKSRLLHEFRQRLGDGATWVEGHALSFGRAIAFHPLTDLLKRTFRIEEGDPEATISTKIERAVLRLGDDLRPILPHLRYLLAVDPGDSALGTMDPKQRRAEIFDGVRRLMLRASEVRPQIIVFEDLHWIDQATEEYLCFAADSIPTSRLLLLLTYRPGYVHSLGERTYHTQIALTPLSTEASMRMAESMLLGAGGLPDELKALVARKAEGNPFFVEEVVKALQEVGAIRRSDDRYVLTRPIHEIVVPDTVQDVLMARIDRLADAPKKTLQLASVIGREFARRLLDRLAELRERTDEHLRELKAIELIYEKTLFPELAYLFKHALTHEVAYSSLLVGRRRELHRLIGLAIEELYADRLAEQYEVLAHHFFRAEEWDKALDYLLKAAEKATRAFATREALALYDQALEAARGLGDAARPETVMTIYQAKSALYFVVSDFEGSRAEAQELLVIARRVHDRVREGAALAAMAWASTWARDLDHAIAYAREAIEAGGQSDPQPFLARAHFTIGFVRAVTGGLEEADHQIGRALVISQSAGDVVHESLALSVTGLLRNWQGEFAAAARLQSRGLRIARERNLLTPLLFSSFLYGITLTGKGDYDEGAALFQEGLTLAEKVGDEAIHHRLLNCLGWLHLELGDFDRAIELNRQSAEVGRRRRDPGTLPNSVVNLGEVFMLRGDLGLAQEHFDDALRLARDPASSEWMKFRYLIRLYASLGELWLARGDPAKAGEFAAQCLELAARTNARKNLVKGWRLKGEAALARGKLDEAERALRQALDTARAVGNPPQLWKIHAAWGRLHTKAGRSELALQAYQAARAVVDPVKAGLKSVELRESLERLPQVRQIYELSAPA